MQRLIDTQISDRMDHGTAVLDDLSSIFSEMSGKHYPLSLISDMWLSAFDLNKKFANWLYKASHQNTISIFSNNPGFIRDLLPVGIIFHSVLLSGEYGEVKPSLSIFQRFDELAADLNEKILFIDDKASNIVVAKELGWETYLYNDFRRFLKYARRVQ